MRILEGGQQSIYRSPHCVINWSHCCGVHQSGHYLGDFIIQFFEGSLDGDKGFIHCILHHVVHNFESGGKGGLLAFFKLPRGRPLDIQSPNLLVLAVEYTHDIRLIDMKSLVEGIVGIPCQDMGVTSRGLCSYNVLPGG
jgi:hypothetical protein